MSPVTADPQAPEGAVPGRPFVVLGVGGGIAAYKVAELLRGLTESGHDVRVVPTAAALRFVGEPTWAALSGQPVHTEVWDDVHEVPHVRLGQRADLVVVAPATADLLAKAAHGRADDLLTSTLLTARCPVLMVPAMHTEMWTHPATQANVATLRARGVLVLDPAAGRLTGADSGPGRMPEPADILGVARSVLAHSAHAPRSGCDTAAGRSAAPADLAGRRVLVTAGGTREPLDPVRFLGNRSSGRQGLALARAALVRGAEVVLVAAHLAVPEPAGVSVVRVGSTSELYDAVLAQAGEVDAVVMAAAPADFRPTAYTTSKIKKRADGVAPTIELAQTPDVLAGLVEARRSGAIGPAVLVGFAAETGDGTGAVLDHGRAKLARKGCDLLVVNEVGETLGFGTDDNAAVILGSDGLVHEVPRGPKDVLAHVVWDLVVPRFSGAVEAGS